MNEIDLGNVMILLAPTPAAKGKAGASKSSTYSSAEQAAAAAPFNLLLPGSPLPGHELLDAAVLTSPAQAAALTYQEKDGHRQYIIAQSPLAIGTGTGKSRVSAIGQSLAEATVAGQPAALLLGSNNGQHPQPLTLFWTRNDVLVQVAGMGYSLDELTRAAESLA